MIVADFRDIAVIVVFVAKVGNIRAGFVGIMTGRAAETDVEYLIIKELYVL